MFQIDKITFGRRRSKHKKEIVYYSISLTFKDSVKVCLLAFVYKIMKYLRSTDYYLISP